MSRVLPPASSARAPHASAPENPARAARHAARQSASLACLKPSRRVGFASLAPRRDARRSGTLAASEDPDAEVEAMVDVDAIRAMIDSDPAVRAQEARIASEARNAASLQVDKQMAEASDAIRSELSRRGSAASDELAKTQEAALAELEVRSDAVLRAEAKMREIAAEREALEAPRARVCARGGARLENHDDASSPSEPSRFGKRQVWKTARHRATFLFREVQLPHFTSTSALALRRVPSRSLARLLREPVDEGERGAHGDDAR